jgi:hypothetical protein
LLPHPGSVTWSGFLWNQAWVILGNAIGGGVFVGGLYWLASLPVRAHAESSGTLPGRMAEAFGAANAGFIARPTVSRVWAEARTRDPDDVT